MRLIAQAIQDMVLKSVKSVEELVEAAFGFSYDDYGNRKPNKSHHTLYREVNPEDAGAKLGYMDAILLMQAAENTHPLSLAAEKLGYKLVPITENTDGKDLAEECFQAVEACVQLATLARDPNRGHYTELAPLLEKAHKEIDDIFVHARMADNMKGGNHHA